MARETLRVHLANLCDEGLIDWYEGRLTLPDTKWEPPEEFAEYVF